MTDRETLKRIGAGIMERMPNVVRVRVGVAVFGRLYDDLKACEYEYEFVGLDGEKHKDTMCFRWTRPGLDKPHFLVYGKPVEVDPTLAADAVEFDGRDSM